MAEEEVSGRSRLRREQVAALGELLRVVRAGNPFYRDRLAGVAAVPDQPDEIEAFLERVPFTTKAELSDDQAAHPPFGTNLTFAVERYTRLHQTSGTSGRPLRWLDTPESWDGLVADWAEVYRAAGVGPGDRVYFAFSFGPFIGFWMAFEAAARLGMLCLPGGGQSTTARLRGVLDLEATVLCCTPTYALHLAEVAAREGVDLAGSRVRRLIVAGEPGGSIPSTRARLESAWPGARVFDHHGMTEVGPVTHECPDRPGRLHVLERSYLAEVIDPRTGRPVADGQQGELVLTTLRRHGSPVWRYRTGDLVRPRFAPANRQAPLCDCGRCELALEGGILGRADDMIIVRGVNVHPGAVEEILRRFPEVAEYQVAITESDGLSEMVVRVETTPDCADLGGLVRQIDHSFRTVFSLRVPVLAVPPGSLPRFELKARRWVRRPGG